MLYLTLFGPPVISFNETPIRFSVATSEILLIYLYSNPVAHTRESLCALLVPTLPPKKARAHLSDALYRMRQALEAAGVDPTQIVLADRKIIQLQPGAVSCCDVTHFIQNVQSADASIALKWAALKQYKRGKFLNGLELPSSSNEFEAWLSTRRRDLEYAYVDLLRQLMDQSLKEEDYANYSMFVQELIALGQADDAEVGLALIFAALLGNRSLIDHIFNSYKFIKGELLGLDPSNSLRSLYMKLHDNLFDPETLTHHLTIFRDTQPEEGHAHGAATIYPNLVASLKLDAQLDFDDTTRELLQSAGHEAVNSGSMMVGTSHLFIALLEKLDTSQAKALIENHNCTCADLQAILRSAIVRDESNKPFNGEYTLSLIEMLSRARRYANKEDACCIQLEHIWRSMQKVNSGIAYEIMRPVA